MITPTSIPQQVARLADAFQSVTRNRPHRTRDAGVELRLHSWGTGRRALGQRPRGAILCSRCRSVPSRRGEGSARATGQSQALPVMFLFFSNRTGCLGSIAISFLVTLVLLKACGMY